mmetsp:Transcript_10360/g.23370  ORF Transcript_10360/g.23370 Transcript_10360/m.23370 type:complete len:808 (+) Transcript_10360:89-2512(+)
MTDDIDDFDMDVGADEPDPLDAENFNPVDYINKQFPNAASLGDLDPFVERLKAQQRQIDDDIRHAVRRQAVCGRRARADLAEAKAAVKELLDRIKTIKAKAEQSEVLVSDVCRDIKSLDTAKRNLTLTVTALKRLVMLVTALEQLRTLGATRQYQEASGLIFAVDELAGHFQDLSHVPRVADLLERKASIQGDLRNQLLEDYASLLGPEHSRHEGLESASHCVDAMGPSMRREVITQFCLSLLEDYKAIFEPPKEASGLETAERRYAWLKRTLREMEEKYQPLLPEAWKVPCSLCEHFCHLTRQHLVEVLSSSYSKVDPELMVRVLRKSIEFENDLARKYPEEEEAKTVQLQKSGGGDKADPADFAPRFRGIISECFEAYLGTWVQHEEQELVKFLERACVQGQDKIVGQDDEKYEEEDEDGSEPRYLYSSAPELFAAMKTTMTKCTGFSTQKTLFDIFQVFRKIIAKYVDRLNAQLPKVKTALEPGTVQVVCTVVGTAEYCDETVPMLSESMLKVIDASYEERVTFAHEQELIGTAMASAMQVLVQSVERSLDDVFARMTKSNWAEFTKEEMVDQSPYVGEIGERLSSQLAPVARYLSKLHYRFFCDKFVQSFVVRFISEIYKCRKISEEGAHQMLRDTSLIKTTLLEAPVIAGQGRQLPTAYSNYVLREMGRAEAMLKVLGSKDIEHLPPSAVGELLAESGATGAASIVDIDRLLSLRLGYEGEGPGPLPSLRGDGERSDASNVQSFRAGIFKMADTMNRHSEQTTQDFQKGLKDVNKKLTSGFKSLGFNIGSTKSKSQAPSSSS